MYQLNLTLLSPETLEPMGAFENETLAQRVMTKLGMADLCGILPQQYETGSGLWRAEDLIAFIEGAQRESKSLVRYSGLQQVEVPWSLESAKHAADDPLRQGGIENITMGDISVLRYQTNQEIADPDRAPLEADLGALMVFVQSGLAANAILRNAQFAPVL